MYSLFVKHYLFKQTHLRSKIFEKNDLNEEFSLFFFNNETWSGEEALKLGVIDEITEPDDLIQRSLKVAISWGKWAKSSRSGTKQLLDSQSYNDFETQLHNEQERIVGASQTEQFSEGVDAFLEKRKPKFGYR